MTKVGGTLVSIDEEESVVRLVIEVEKEDAKVAKAELHLGAVSVSQEGEDVRFMSTK